MLSARAIVKSFAGRQVLRDVNLDIAPGSITCVIGPSGTGKTTLLRALALLECPDTGTITIDQVSYSFTPNTPTPILGDRTDGLPPPWPHVTAVFQSLFLWPHLTLRENIMLPGRQRNPNAEEDLAGLIAFFEMGGFIDNFPNQASVGQRQRVALARALILNPRYVLLDEITSSLDIEQTARILDKLSHLKSRGIGVFLITHHIGFAQRAADQVIFMDGGTIIEAGPADIIVQPKTERLARFLHMARDIG